MSLFYLANIRLPTEKAHGIQIMHTGAALAVAGVNITLIVPTRKNTIAENPFEYYGTHYGIPETENFSLLTLWCPDFVPFGKFGAKLQALCFALRVFFFALFHTAHTDILYARHEALLFLPSIFLGNPIFWESHNGAFSFLTKRVARCANGIISLTKGGRDFYISKSVPAEKILVAEDGVDAEKFAVKETTEDCREKLGLPNNGKIVGYIGVGSIGIYDWKGVDTFLNASRLDPETIFLLVGGGREEAVRKM